MANKKRLQSVTPPPPQRTMTKRQLTRYQREQQAIRRIVVLISAALAICLLVLLIPIYINVIVNPNRTVATVEGQNLNRATYDKQRRWDLYQQVQQDAFYYQYQQQSGQSTSTTGTFAQSSQYSTDIQNLNTVSDSPIDGITLGNLVDNTLIVKHASSEFNLHWSNDDIISSTIQDQAPPPQQPTPTSVPVITPTATLTVTGTPATPTTIIPPTSTITPTNTSTPTPGGPSPTPTQTPTVTQTPTITPTPIPVAGASATAGTRYNSLINEVSGTKPDPSTTYCQLACPGLSKDDYLNLIAQPAYLKKEITNILQARVPTSTLQLQLSQIQTDNKADADAAKALLDAGTGFQTVASQKSTDTATKDQGGDMGYIARGQQSPEFDAAVFDVNPKVGQIIGPFQDSAGWHIVTVVDSQANKALTPTQLSTIKGSAFDNWLAALKKKDTASGALNLSITPTPTSVPVPTTAPAPTVAPADTPITSTNTLTGTQPISGTSPLTSTQPASGTTPTTPPVATTVASPPTPTTNLAASPTTASPAATPTPASAATPTSAGASGATPTK